MLEKTLDMLDYVGWSRMEKVGLCQAGSYLHGLCRSGSKSREMLSELSYIYYNTQ